MSIRYSYYFRFFVIGQSVDLVSSRYPRWMQETAQIVDRKTGKIYDKITLHDNGTIEFGNYLGDYHGPF